MRGPSNVQRKTASDYGELRGEGTREWGQRTTGLSDNDNGVSLIYQYYEGEMSYVIKKCTEAMRRYAERIGSEYRLERRPLHISLPASNPYIRALDGFYNDKFDRFSNVVVVDADVHPRRNLDLSVFDVSGHMAYHEPTEYNRWKRKRSTRGIPVFQRIGGNGGIYKLTQLERKKVKEVLLEAIKMQEKYYSANHHEEYIMHCAFELADIHGEDMGMEWNYTHRSKDYTPIENAKFFHLIYNGTKEDSYEAVKEYL